MFVFDSYCHLARRHVDHHDVLRACLTALGEVRAWAPTVAMYFVRGSPLTKVKFTFLDLQISISRALPRGSMSLAVMILVFYAIPNLLVLLL